MLFRNIFKVLTMPSSKFSNLPSALPPSQRLIWVRCKSVSCVYNVYDVCQVDCEMTGLNLEKDKLMEIACIVTEGDTLQTVGNSFNRDWVAWVMII